MAVFDNIKGIGVASGFKLQAKSALDPRLTVASLTERDELVTSNGAYEGMSVYVKANKKTYQLQGTTNNDWVDITGDGGSTSALEKRVDNVEADVDVIKYYDDPTVTPSPTSWFIFAENDVDNDLLIVGLTDDGKAAITSGTTEIVIPYEINGKFVTALSGGSLSSIFDNLASKITKVVLPNTILRLSSAFFDCTSLVSLNIPENVTDIGNGAFDNCTSLVSLNIPESVTRLSPYAFNGCTGLTSISIPKSISIDTTTLTQPLVPSTCTIYCEQGSDAESAAKKYNNPIVYTDIKPIAVGEGLVNTIDKTNKLDVKIDPATDNALTKTTTGLKVVVPEGIDYTVSVDTTKTTAGAAKSYVFKQYDKTTKAEKEIATIDIPKDMVVSSGEVTNLETKPTDFPTGQTFTAGMYIILTIANSTASKLYIPATGLVDVYTGGNTLTIETIIGDNNTILSNINTNSIGKTLLTTALQNKIDEIDNINNKVNKTDYAEEGSKAGIVKPDASFFTMKDFDDSGDKEWLTINVAADVGIEAREASGFITPSNLNAAVKAALTDNNRISDLTDEEKIKARTVIGAIATTLEGYGITDAYTKTVIDEALEKKANIYIEDTEPESSSEKVYNVGDLYYDQILGRLFILEAAEPTDGNTDYQWTRLNPEIIDDLTTTSTNKVLSANQGKVLKDLVDTKADSDDLIAISTTANLAKTAAEEAQVTADSKVDKVEGKGLSTNDYTTEEKQKLSGLPPYDTMEGLFEEKANKVTDITNDSTDTEYPSAAAVWNIVSGLGQTVKAYRQSAEIQLSYKQDKTTIEELEPANVPITIGGNNKEWRCTAEAVTLLAITFPNGEYDTDYTEGLVFDSGSTPTHVSYSSTGIIQWVGTDCFISDDNKSVFKPSANTHYDIVFYYNGGSYIVGLVNGYKTAVGNQEANA